MPVVGETRPGNAIPISPHARRRMNEMRVSDAQVHECVRDPDMSYPSLGYENRRTYCRGELLVATEGDPGERYVVSVLWNKPGETVVREEQRAV